MPTDNPSMAPTPSFCPLCGRPAVFTPLFHNHEDITRKHGAAGFACECPCTEAAIRPRVNTFGPWVPVEKR